MPTPLDIMQSKKEVVDVFLDYENVRRTALSIFYEDGSDPHLGVVDPIQLAEFLVEKRERTSILRSVHVFRGRPNPTRQPKPAAAFNRLHDQWSISPKFVPHVRDVKYSNFGTDPCTGEETFTAMEKGVDVELAVTLIDTASSGLSKPDAVILMSNDTDLEPAVLHVMQKTDTHIEIAAWSGPGSYPLYIRKFLNENPNRKVPYCHFVGEDCFNKVCQDNLFT